MGNLVYDRQTIVWEIDVLRVMEAEGRAKLLEPHGIWIVDKAGGGKVAVRPEQIVVDGMSMAEIAAQQEAELAAENAWLTAAEAPTAEDFAFEDHERSQGVVSFEDAWEAADPVFAAGRALRYAERAAFDQATFENGKTSIGLEAPEWVARMQAITEEILSEQGTSTAVQEAKIAAVAKAQADAAQRAQENDLLAHFTKPKGV